MGGAESNPEFEAEVKRLKLLPKAIQRQIVAIYAEPAKNPNLTDEERKEARRRADDLLALMGPGFSPFSRHRPRRRRGPWRTEVLSPAGAGRP
jgi:hypothetical protein